MLSGGSADKLGNRYERWWTVSQLVRMLQGLAESIRIEDPGVIKAEFVIVSKGRKELHQVKRSHQSGKWSLASLGGSDAEILQAIFAQLSGNDDRFVFVSESEARELKELAWRAEKAETVEEFVSRFLEAETQKTDFDKLTECWNNVDAATAHNILRRIEVRTIDERSLEELVKGKLPALFLADPEDVCDKLRCITEDSVHQTITRDALVARVEQRFRLRRLVNPGAAPTLIGEVTRNYLAVARRKLIGKSLIFRAATRTLLERMDAQTCGGDFVLTGKAGAGKTGCAIEFVEALQTRGVPVLAFRLDHLQPMRTTTELGQRLGLEESPALVLAGAATGRETVLVVDQLDAVSTASGRSTGFFEAVEGLLAEARGLRDKLKLHVVVVCRAFDWENDHRLRHALADKPTKVEVLEFSLDEVKAVLSAERFSVSLFQPRQLNLLRLPQNLSLFLDGGSDPAMAPQFNTEKDLLKRYWDEKRRAVRERTTHMSEQWMDVIQRLCQEMTDTQQLSVPREILDAFAADYVDQMASEGVLTLDGRRYGFGLESFFDYCFARMFVAKNQSLVDFLTTSEQHLFRRAQVRQVLTYLRDADRSRYCAELCALLTNANVRIHIKDLAVAVAVDVADPDNDEWELLAPWLNSELQAFANGQGNGDQFATLVWQHFFGSASWFRLADQRGLIASWLASDKDGLVNMAVNYLRFHQRHSGDRVAELLEPYIGRGDDWTQRLRCVMEWAEHENSRRFFELFLRLVDDGTLDKARGPIAANSTFWSMLHGLATVRPEWLSEVIAHWLRRRIVLIQQEKAAGAEAEWRDLFNHDDFGSQHFHDAAFKAPAAFIQHVLPVILEITDAAVYADETSPPKRDALWPTMFGHSQYESVDDACRNALSAALEKLVKTTPGNLRNVVAELRRRDTYIANFLLLRLYTAGAEHFADEAVSALCREPWRFDCGFSDSSYWVAVQLIGAVASRCSPDNRAKLEVTILGYSPDYERTTKGHKHLGRAGFVLLSAIPREHRSQNAQARYEELKRKYEAPDGPPVGIRGGHVESPIKKQAAEKMTDEQWLKAIAKYRSERHELQFDDPTKGGVWELAGMLRTFVQKEPERFARLSLQFPTGTNPVYIRRTLEGLKDIAVATELKLSVCRKAYAESRQECGEAIADLLGSVNDVLPDDCVEMLQWLATEHPDPDKELWNEKATSGQPYYGGDILMHGINTARGRAAEAIRDLIDNNADYIRYFLPTVERLLEDRNLSVRACVASTLLAIAHHDTPLAVRLFQKLAETDERLLQTHHADKFIYHGLQEHFPALQPCIVKMLRSTVTKVSEAGSRLACLAFLINQKQDCRRFPDVVVDFFRKVFRIRPGERLVAEAMRGSAPQRKGVAVVAATNIVRPQCRQWCELHLLRLFNDAAPEVRREAASCFRQLQGQPLESYEKLVTAFCDSAAYQEDSFWILHVLEESAQRLPGVACVVCEKFLARFSDEARDIRTHRAADVHTVAKLILRTYHQHQQDQWASRCLDLIDRMCLEGIHAVKSGLQEFER